VAGARNEIGVRLAGERRERAARELVPSEPRRKTTPDFRRGYVELTIEMPIVWLIPLRGLSSVRPV
jgi:hypothetical protein